MKTNFKILAAMALLTLVAFIITACTATKVITHNADGTTTTTSVKSFDAERACNFVHATVPLAIPVVLRFEPSARRYIVDAQVGFCALSTTTNVAPADLAAVVQRVGLNNITASESRAALASVKGMYDSLWYDLNHSGLSNEEIVAKAQVVITAICESITTGLPTASVPLRPADEDLAEAMALFGKTFPTQ